MRANQIRLFFSSIAYTLAGGAAAVGPGRDLDGRAQCQTIRLKLLKIGALVQVTVRKVWVRLASSCPYASLFRRVHERLSGLSPPAAAMT